MRFKTPKRLFTIMATANFSTLFSMVTLSFHNHVFDGSSRRNHRQDFLIHINVTIDQNRSLGFVSYIKGFL